MASTANPPPPGYQIYEANLGPTFLRGPFGAAWLAAFGAQKDALLGKLKNGFKARLIPTAPLDAIGLIGSDRGIQQGPTETLASYQNRLENAWGEWQPAGAAWGILAQLGAAGYAGAYVMQANGLVFGPSGNPSSGGVTAPDPINGIAGTPPAVTQLGPYYASGGMASTWAAHTNFQVGAFVQSTAGWGTNGAYWCAATTGTTGSTEPGFVSGNYQDGSVLWVPIASYLTQPVSPGFVIPSANGQGASWFPGADEPSMPSPYPDLWNIGPSQMTGPSFWNRFVLIIDPVPSSWAASVIANTFFNPPTGTSIPSASEIDYISGVINRFTAGHAACLGIMARISTTDNRSAWGWPLPVDGAYPSDWFSRMGSFSGVPNPTKPQSLLMWSPNTTLPLNTVNLMTPSRGVVSTNPDTTRLAWYYSTGGGTTGWLEPAWPAYGTVTDNGITWTFGGTLSQWFTTQTVVTFQVSSAS